MADSHTPYGALWTAAPSQGQSVTKLYGRRVAPFAPTRLMAVLTIVFLCYCVPSAVVVLFRSQAFLTEPAGPTDAFHGLLSGWVAAQVAFSGFFCLAGILFIVWLYRAYRNLPALGNRDLEYSPGWCIGAWFIPIAGLIIPCQIMIEVWKGSDPQHACDAFRAKGQVPQIVLLWWGAYVVMVVCSGVEMFASREIRVNLCWVRTAATILGAYFAMLVLWCVSVNQGLRYVAIEAIANRVQDLPASEAVAFDENAGSQPIVDPGVQSRDATLENLSFLPPPDDAS